MKLINKIKAFFKRKDEPMELDLVAAEIREGKAFLHTKGEESITYMVRANDIEIRLNKDANIMETDILMMKRRDPREEKKIKQAIAKVEAQKKQEDQKKQVAAAPTAAGTEARGEVIDFDRFKKRKFSISVYPEEYEAIQSVMKEYGYKQADFVLACISTATKGTMEKAHKKIVKSHREILLERQAMVAKQIAEMNQNGGQTG